MIIPKESIRFRIIANSNEKKDQELKYKIVSNLNTELNNQTNIINARNEIKNRIPEITTSVQNTLNQEKSKQNFQIKYGLNYFPEKEYKGIKYEAGEYESLVITLGNGLGENFWCVLFPPLCLLETTDNNSTEVEYSSLVKEIIDKYF